jgi:hypothetical protein
VEGAQSAEVAAGYRELNNTVTESDNGAGALNIIESEPGIALLVNDVLMPDRSGKKLAEETL